MYQIGWKALNDVCETVPGVMMELCDSNQMVKN